MSTTAEATMDLAVVNVQNAVQIFTAGGLGAVLEGIETKVRSMQLDASTSAGREEIRSVAYRVARTKVALDTEGKRLTEGWRDATKKVNEERKRSTERLDALAEEIRKPLTEFENKERIRVNGHESALAEMSGLRDMLNAYPEMTVALLEDHQKDFSSLHCSREWEEFTMRADKLRADISTYLNFRIEARRKFDADQAELARLREEAIIRLQRERDERLQAESAEKARLEAERKAAEVADEERRRVAAEAQRVQEEHERARLAAEKRAKDAEDARIASEKKAEADRLAAESKAAENLRLAKEKTKRDADAAVAKERERVERERKAIEDARIKREADQAHKHKIRDEIASDLRGGTGMDMDEDVALWIANAIIDGKIRHLKVVF